VKWSDILWAALLFGGAVLALSFQPPNLGPADESVYLYQAKRVLEGAVPYRDVFDLTTPGWLYVMAALFGLFGVSLETARLATAILHGITAVMIYATGRRLAVRPALAWPAGLAYLLVCQPAWPSASQHWRATSLSVLLRLLCSGRPGRQARWALWPGVVIGALIAVHQQRGLLVGIGTVVWLIADVLLQRRAGAEPPPPLASSLAWLAAGAAVPLVPLFLGLLAAAGFAPVWQALVLHPLHNYRTVMHTRWGQSGGIMAEAASYTYPELLRFLPLVLVPDLLRAGVLAVRGRPLTELRRLALLIVFAVSAVLSIAYYPDYIHIAFIAPVFFVGAAELAERVVGGLAGRSRALRLAGYLAGAVLLAGGGLRLKHNLDRLWRSYPLSRNTAFGRVNFALPFEAELYDTMRVLVDGVPGRQLFCYPIVSYLYLMLDADNPTRYQFLLRGYTSPEQMDEVVRVLQERRLPYIVVLPGFLAPDDPIMAYLRRDYEPMTEAGEVGKAIYRRKADPAAIADPPAEVGTSWGAEGT
jgi:hypothetical protein